MFIQGLDYCVMWIILLHMYILLRLRRVTCMITGILNVFSDLADLDSFFSEGYRKESA